MANGLEMMLSTEVELLQAENARLREELAAAQADAARYRWLREEAAEVWIDFEFARVFYSSDDPSDNSFGFTKGDYQSLALDVLRAASAVYRARGE